MQGPKSRQKANKQQIHENKDNLTAWYNDDTIVINNKAHPVWKYIRLHIIRMHTVIQTITAYFWTCTFRRCIFKMVSELCGFIRAGIERQKDAPDWGDASFKKVCSGSGQGYGWWEWVCSPALCYCIILYEVWTLVQCFISRWAQSALHTVASIRFIICFLADPLRTI